MFRPSGAMNEICCPATTPAGIVITCVVNPSAVAIPTPVYAPFLITPEFSGAALDMVPLHVVTRPDLDMTFVVEPGTDASIEVTGTGLLAETDRLVVVNCQDTCGVSGPSAQVGFPDGEEVGAFAYFPPPHPAPLSDF